MLSFTIGLALGAVVAFLLRDDNDDDDGSGMGEQDMTEQQWTDYLATCDGAAAGFW